MLAYCQVFIGHTQEGNDFPAISGSHTGEQEFIRQPHLGKFIHVYVLPITDG